MTELFTHVSGNTYKYVGPKDWAKEMGVASLFEDYFHHDRETFCHIDIAFIGDDIFVTETEAEASWYDEGHEYVWGHELLA